MFPFAVSCDDFPRDAEMLMEAGLGVSKAMRQRKGEGYEAGQACDLTYRYVMFSSRDVEAYHLQRAPGDAIDFAYGITDVRWSYSAELRDTGTVSLVYIACL
jgi:extracellular matrix protein 14